MTSLPAALPAAAARAYRRSRDRLQGSFFRLAAGGAMPARWFSPPPPAARAARSGVLHVEIVSHCWRYSRLLACQLRSLQQHPPRDVRVTMTVVHAREDAETVALLEATRAIAVPNVRWRWMALPPAELFRRAIGRNRAGRATAADWVWFTDCDVVFGPGCLDGLARALQGCDAVLVHPREELGTPVLDADDLGGVHDGRALVDPVAMDCTPRRLTRATGPMQIVHGDVARARGYCADIALYQRPAAQWCKAHEDRAFRWLLGTPGLGVAVPAVYRVRHAHKGRDAGRRSPLRAMLRRWRTRRQDRPGTARA
ncbi:glycosyltransferase family 2 protein [Algiphilus sp.]|uniref:glycosyltransferase family 2 protein n=1 Tax=Algiphilus sp. TaxID=1872431 RepID=UPI0025BB6DE7|nr:glycosyltransferase family A protein [Algiphilus sp.]MCK5771961.1 glycosyltransferase family 2 protein [Algiphilus sp.]